MNSNAMHPFVVYNDWVCLDFIRFKDSPLCSNIISYTLLCVQKKNVILYQISGCHIFNLSSLSFHREKMFLLKRYNWMFLCESPQFAYDICIHSLLVHIYIFLAIHRNYLPWHFCVSLKILNLIANDADCNCNSMQI